MQIVLSQILRMPPYNFQKEGGKPASSEKLNPKQQANCVSGVSTHTADWIEKPSLQEYSKNNGFIKFILINKIAVSVFITNKQLLTRIHVNT